MHRERREYNIAIISFHCAKMVYVDKLGNLRQVQHPTGIKDCFDVFKPFFHQL